MVSKKSGLDENLKESVRSGNSRALARASTLIENQTLAGRELLDSLFAETGRSLTIGITGPPGAGKSTLVSQLTRTLRGQGKTVGILAVDPSSSYSHGAILGDRIRMQEHHGDSGVFIRSMATRGQLGGLARTTFDLAILLDAAGFDVILIETVGTGQDEVDIAGMADVTVVVLAPGSGDDVQALKAGIMEIADVFAINKADLPGAEHVEQDIRAMQSLASPNDRRMAAPIRRVSASEAQGIDDLLRAIEEVATAQARGRSAELTWRNRLRHLLRVHFDQVVPKSELDRHAHSVAARAESPYAAVGQIARSVVALSTVKRGIDIDHLGIAVRSLTDGLRFYSDQLGIEAVDIETVAVEEVKVAMLPVGEARIELLEPTGDESTIASFIAKRGPGLHHVALRVEDLEATVRRLISAGARLLNEPRAGAGGHVYVFVHPASTGGVLLELIQRRVEKIS
jgi:GTPase